MHRLFSDDAVGLMALSAAFLSAAMVIDLQLPFLPRFGPIEELCELSAAVALLAAVITMVRAPAASRESWQDEMPDAGPILPRGQS